MALIEAVTLRKQFGETVAVEDVSLTVKSGQIYGLVGSDGAGKTTTLRLLVGALKPDGLFMAALLGSRALLELRQALLEAEAETEGGASPRVSPFADVRDYGALLQRAGFALPVADVQTLTVVYPSPRELMREVRALGGGNVLLARSRAPLSRKTLERAEAIYRERHASPDGRVSASFEIVYLSGWGPDASQQQPLRPGSAAQRLADALGTTEQPAGDKAAFPAKPKL